MSSRYPSRRAEAANILPTDDVLVQEAISDSHRSPMRVVYDINAIRCNIIYYLTRKSVLRMMRTEKRNFEDCAKIIYERLTHDNTVKLFGTRGREIDGTRDAIYRASVSTVDARMRKFGRHDMQELDADQAAFDSLGYHQRKKVLYAQHYRPEVVSYLAPLYRSIFPNLQHIILGSSPPDDITETITVDLTPSPRKSPGTASIPLDKTSIRGHANYLRLIKHDSAAAPTAISKSPTAPDLFTLSHYFDLVFQNSYKRQPMGGRLPPANLDWLSTIRETEWLTHLHGRIEFGDLPVTLDDLTSLFERQKNIGGCTGIKTVVAKACRGYGLDDLRHLGRHAFSSLRILCLTDKMGLADISLSFEDLPGLTDVIRNALPHLVTLHIGMKGLETAEADCRSFLHENILDERGTLTDLHIYSSCQTYPEGYNTLFNVLRVLSPMCAKTMSKLEVTFHSGYGRYYHMFIDIIRRQSLEKRRHLAIVDFASLGYESIEQLLNMRYYDDGRPRPRWESKADEWKSAIEAVVEASFKTEIPDLQSSLLNAQSSVRRIYEIVAADESAPVALDEARRLLDSLQSVSSTAARLRDMGRTAQVEIDSYISMLKDRERKTQQEKNNLEKAQEKADAERQRLAEKAGR